MNSRFMMIKGMINSVNHHDSYNTKSEAAGSEKETV